MHMLGLEPTTSPSTMLLQGKDVPFELEFSSLNFGLESQPK